VKNAIKFLYALLSIVFYFVKGVLYMISTIRHIHTRLPAWSIGFLLLFLGSNSFFSASAFAVSVRAQASKPNKDYYTVTLPVNNAVLINPGKGWVLYGTPATQTAKTLAYASVGYTRYNWSDIEPSEGKYNWSIIDSDMNAWKAVGKKFAFGVMNANSSTPTNQYVTPEWVFKDGAAAIKSGTYDKILKRKGIQYIPVWNDPIFLRKVQDFVTAMAKRYDGNPDIAYIDIRSYGNWGLQEVNSLPHSVALSSRGAGKHIRIYSNAFRHTQLIVPWGSPAYKSAYGWATNHSIGVRQDGLMVSSDGKELAMAYGKTPAVFEFYSSYQWLKQHGYWQNSKLLTAVNAGKPSYISMGGWGNDAQVMLAQHPQLIHRLANMIGYNFTLKSATLPISITNRRASTFSFSWKNQGVAFLNQSATVAVALLDGSNRVVQKQWLRGVRPEAWKPGKITITSKLMMFTGVHAGTYKLAVGLFLRTADSNPTYEIGNRGRTSNGWYVISNRELVK
jgi:Domain of unknown function (DUF4832)/Beta-galactosidase